VKPSPKTRRTDSALTSCSGHVALFEPHNSCSQQVATRDFLAHAVRLGITNAKVKAFCHTAKLLPFDRLTDVSLGSFYWLRHPLGEANIPRMESGCGYGDRVSVGRGPGAAAGSSIGGGDPVISPLYWSWYWDVRDQIVTIVQSMPRGY
jgi:hypothetical protein